jgi:hypothetical protein
MLRFELSQAPDLGAWHDFERCLVAPARLHEDLAPDVVADLETSVALIEQVRRQAGRETGLEALPYYAGLLVWAVSALARYDPDEVYYPSERQRGAHLLLAASLLAHRVDELARAHADAPDAPADPDLSPHVLRLDEDGVRVWVAQSRAVALTGLRLKLFLRLYEQPGQVVPANALIEAVWGTPYIQEGTLPSLVRRLREDIEPDPSRPRYILTVRGQGYRLELGGTPNP